MIEIRLATLDDLRDLRRVAIETQVDTFGIYNSPENMEAFLRETYDLKQLEKEFAEPGSCCYLACEDAELAGFLRLRQSGEVEKILGSNTIELQRLFYGGLPCLPKSISLLQPIPFVIHFATHLLENGTDLRYIQTVST